MELFAALVLSAWLEGRETLAFADRVEEKEETKISEMSQSPDCELRVKNGKFLFVLKDRADPPQSSAKAIDDDSANSDASCSHAQIEELLKG